MKTALSVLVMLVVAAAAFVTGPSAAAVRIRSSLSSAAGWVRDRAAHRGVSAGPVGEWTYAHRRGLRVGVVALAAVIFVFIGHPNVAEVVWILVLLVILLGLIELLGTPPAPQPEPVADADAPPPAPSPTPR